MELWTLEHRVFEYEHFFRNGESITAVQREFRREFNIHRNDHVPKCDTILRWVNNLRTSGSFMEKKKKKNLQRELSRTSKGSEKRFCEVQAALLGDILQKFK